MLLREPGLADAGHGASVSVDAAQVMADLDAFATDLDAMSKALAQVEREREPLQKWHDDVVEAMTAHTWRQHAAGELKRLPSAAVVEALAREKMREQAEGLVRLEHLAKLTASRKRLQARTTELASAISARQSILSMLKLELQAGGAR